jgi:hypothetical protein
MSSSGFEWYNPNCMKPELQPGQVPEILTLPPEEVTRLFIERFRCYQAHQIEIDIAQVENRKPTLDAQRHFVDDKEELALLTYFAFRQSSSLEQFEERIRAIISQAAHVPTEQVDDYIATEHILPFTFQRRSEPGAIESIWSTLERLNIATAFARIGRNHTSSIVLSGSTAWGAFFATRNETPESLRQYGVQKVGYRSASDIDLLLTCSDIVEMEKLIDAYIDSGLLDHGEQNRFKIFQNLFTNGEAEVFSIRAHYREVEESIHILLDETLQSVVDEAVGHRKGNIQYIRDFRPNIPRSLSRDGGYQTHELVTGASTMFSIDITPLTFPDTTTRAGYLSQLPIGSSSCEKDQRYYYLSILSFFLLVAPVILHESHASMSQHIRAMRNRVATVLQGQLPAFIPRQERMPPKFLHYLKEELAKPYDE